MMTHLRRLLCDLIFMPIWTLSTCIVLSTVHPDCLLAGERENITSASGKASGAPTVSFLEQFRSSKGVEFYVDYDDRGRQWLFRLLGGTNRIKEAGAVLAATPLVGIESVREALKGLPQNIFLEFFIIDDAWPGKPEGVHVRALDRKTELELIKICSEKEIRLNQMRPLAIEKNRIITFVASSKTRKELSLAYDPLDDRGLQLIAQKFPGLEILNLRSCGLAHADLSPLRRLKNLRHLDLADTRISDVNATEFAKRFLPQCHVVLPSGMIHAAHK
jgi:Leucine-rich repeat (LRR) protein